MGKQEGRPGVDRQRFVISLSRDAGHRLHQLSRVTRRPYSNVVEVLVLNAAVGDLAVIQGEVWEEARDAGAQ